MGLPAGQGTPDPFVIERPWQVQPALQVVAGADVVPREDVGPSQAPQQDIFPRPTSHAPQAAEALDGLFIGKFGQPLEEVRDAPR